MALIILDAEHNSNGVTYTANSVIDVDAAVVTWLVGVTRGRAIVSGPATWVAGSYPANSLVTVGTAYYVNNASAVSGDVPGVAAKWVQVTYLASGTSGTGTASLSGGILRVKNLDDGLSYQVVSVTVDGVPALTVDPATGS